MFSDVCLVACYCTFGLVMKLLLYWICTQLCSFMKSAKDWIVHSLCFRYNLIFTKEDLGYNTIGADFIGDCVSGYTKLHNVIVEVCSPFSFREYRLQKEKIVPGTGMRHSQSSLQPPAGHRGYRCSDIFCDFMLGQSLLATCILAQKHILHFLEGKV